MAFGAEDHQPAGPDDLLFLPRAPLARLGERLGVGRVPLVLGRLGGLHAALVERAQGQELGVAAEHDVRCRGRPCWSRS